MTNVLNYLYLQRMGKIPVISQCTISYQEDKRFLVDRLEFFLEENQDMVFPHRHNFYHMVLFLTGEGYHEIDFKRYDVQSGQMYFMAPGQVHSWMFQGNVTGFTINFDSDYLKSLLLQSDYVENNLSLFSSLSDQVIQLEGDFLQEMIDLFDKLSELSAINAAKDLKRSLLLYALIKLDQSRQPEQTSKVIDYHLVLIKNFISLVDQHYQKLHLPKEYAEMLFVTPNHLNSVCKEFLGQQAGEVIRNRILLEAKRLLILPDRTVAEVAYTLNFNDNSYFTKFFKKIARVTPEEFRKSQWK